MTKIIFFDLDGTLRETASGKTFINEPTDQKPIEGTQKALSYYQSKGFLCIGITNQGGVAAGHKSLESAIEEQRITLELFPELSEIFFCPNWGESCYQISRNNEPLLFKSPDPLRLTCRKPGNGMILLASQTVTNLSDCWMIGDRPEDQQCAIAAGVKFIWASVLHTKFAGPGVREIECQHIDVDVLTEFLSL
ncbi:HAD-IIIA family hydrolase [Microcoleus sp. herbarium7]|uniref:HAD-IIIA family hydrolase n=1 Tax=Microcoleus sp. herbarium7 TaxID=3055435 RepID=UPI002FCF7685